MIGFGRSHQFFFKSTVLLNVMDVFFYKLTLTGSAYEQHTNPEELNVPCNKIIVIWADRVNCLIARVSEEKWYRYLSQKLWNLSAPRRCRMTYVVLQYTDSAELWVHWNSWEDRVIGLNRKRISGPKSIHGAFSFAHQSQDGR